MSVANSFNVYDDKIVEAKEALQELYDAERDAITQKLDNILDYYDKIESYYDSLIGKLESTISVKEASGQRASITDLLMQYQATGDALSNLEEELWSYQTGLSRKEGAHRTSEEIQAEIDDRLLGVTDTSAYERIADQMNALLDKQDVFNETQEAIKELKAEIKQTTDKELKKELQAELKDLQKVAKEHKLTSAEKKSLNNLTKAYEAVQGLLDNSTYYDKSMDTIAVLQEREQEYNEAMEEIADLKLQKQTAASSEEKKAIQAEIKELQKKAKQAKLTSKEKKTLALLVNNTTNIDTVGGGNTGISKNYANATVLRDALLERVARANDLLDEIDAKVAEKAEALTKEEQKAVQKEINALLKEYNKTKLTSAEQRTLTAVTGQVDTMDQLLDQSIVDNATAQTAEYQGLLIKIGELQNKDKLSVGEQEKLAMYLDELQSINEGVGADSIKQYVTAYEKWWKLNNKTKLSVSQFKQKNLLEQQLSDLKKIYQDQMDALYQELAEANQIEGKDPADLEAAFNKSKKSLEDLYNDQLSYAQDAYQRTARYQSEYAKYLKKVQDRDALAAQIDALKKQGKNTSSKEKSLAKLEKEVKYYQDEMDAMAAGATEANIADYLKAWQWLEKYRAKYEAGTLSNSQQKTWDNYQAQISKWDQEKATEVKRISNELADALKELETTYNTNVADNEEKINDQKEKLWELAKDLAEYQVQALQVVIDNLDSMIKRYQKVAELLSSVSLENIKKYNVMDLFELEDGKSVEDLIWDQLATAINVSDTKISDLVSLGNMYQDLIDAAGDGSEAATFENIFASYLADENTTEEMKGVIESLIEQLNSNNYDANTWVTEWNEAMEETIDSTIEAIEDIQDFKDQLRENVLFKAANNAIEQLDSLNSRLSSMAGVIHEDWVMVGNTLTEYGLSKINLLGQQMANAQKQVAAYAEKVNKIDEAQADDLTAYGSYDEYVAARNEALEMYYSSLQNVESIAYEIYDLGRQAEEAEIESLKSLTEARINALKAKKEYYDYDKTIKNQTKDIEAIKAQLEALNGVNTAEAKAQRAQLEAQLQEAEDALEETQTEHLFELQEAALDKFISDLEATFNDANDTIAATFEEFAESLTSLLNASAGTDIASSLGKITALLMGDDFKLDLSNLNSSDGTLPTLGSVPAGNETGSNSNVEQAVTNAGGSITVSQEEFLSTFSKDMVGVANLLSGLQAETARVNSILQGSIVKELQGIETKMEQNSVTIDNHYDSLLTVNGAVDSTVVSNLNRLTQDIIEQTTNSIIAQLKSAGIYPNR